MIHSAEEFYTLRTSNDPDEYNRAAHEEASFEIWLDVLTKYPDMKFSVAMNKKISIEILKLLANDQDERVRWAVAMKRKLDHALFEKLSNDIDTGVRAAIARNKKAPFELLQKLATDTDDIVRETAISALANEDSHKKRLQ